MITWTLFTVGYGAAVTVGSLGLRSLGDTATRLGRAAGRAG